MSKYLQVFLGVLTAVGGFVDIGDLVTSSIAGSRFGMTLAWAVVLGVVGIIVFAEMAGRVAACSGRAVFDLVRERLGPRVALANLTGSMLVTLLTFVAEIGGVALALQLVANVHHLLIVPLVAFLVWLVIWRMKFSALENIFGLLGLTMIVFGVALFVLKPDFAGLSLVGAPGPDQAWPVYLYLAVALLGSAMTPYEVFFFSSGGIEEKWGEADIPVMRANVFLGFPLGGLLSLAIMATSAVVLLPAGIEVSSLGQVALPVAQALGQIGLAIAIIAFVATTFGAALETGMSCGYTAAQYFGWTWGKRVAPKVAARYHVVVLGAVIAAVGILMTTVDPVKLTEYSVVFSAVALPLTYFPILVVANDLPDPRGGQRPHLHGGTRERLACQHLRDGLLHRHRDREPGGDPAADPHEGRAVMTELDVNADLLDRQVVDSDGVPVCKVDDIVFDRDENGRWRVTGIAVGGRALGPRLGGRLGATLAGADARLRMTTSVAVLPWWLVLRIGSDVRLSVPSAALPADLSPLEDWLRQHVIARIPGSRHASG